MPDKRAEIYKAVLMFIYSKLVLCFFQFSKGNRSKKTADFSFCSHLIRENRGNFVYCPSGCIHLTNLRFSLVVFSFECFLLGFCWRETIQVIEGGRGRSTELFVPKVYFSYFCFFGGGFIPSFSMAYGQPMRK